jgi:hypothetical protein
VASIVGARGGARINCAREDKRRRSARTRQGQAALGRVEVDSQAPSRQGQAIEWYWNEDERPCRVSGHERRRAEGKRKKR